MAVTESAKALPGVCIIGRDAAFCGRLRTQLRALRLTVPLRLLPDIVAADQASVAPAGWADADIVLLDGGLAPGGLAAGPALPAPEFILILPTVDAAPRAGMLDVADYLVPPVRAERLGEALRRALGRRQGHAACRLLAAGASLAVTGRGGVRAVPLDEILYLRAGAKYVAVRTAQAEFLTEKPLSWLQQAFPGHFVQVHRNTLVAPAAIAGVRLVAPDAAGPLADPYREVVLHGVPERLPVARRRWPELRNRLPAGPARFPEDA